MWTVSENILDLASIHHKETIFTIGNGYLCTRGAFEESYPNERRATLIHGVFDDVPVAFTELANAPDWLGLTIFLNGQKFSLQDGVLHQYERTLDLKSGLLKRVVRWQAPGGQTATLIFERFASLADEHLLALRCRILPEFDGTIEVRASLNSNMDNEGVLHWRFLDQRLIPTPQGQVAALRVRTRKSKIELAYAMRLDVKINAHQNNQPEYWDVESIPTLRVARAVRVGQNVEITKFVAIATSRDSADPMSLALRHLENASDFETAFSAHTRAWEDEWNRCDVIIEGDEEAQLAVRFSLYHLLIAAPRHDNRVNIGAKTLSGFGYRGHAFWDTEIFMLPFFTFTSPHIARNLLEYRYLTLPAAREKARRAGYEGAWFAWESAATGEEVTPTWVPDFHDPKKLARVWTGDLAIHISADVAYGVWQYWQVTGDDEWFARYGAELILDAAKFYASRAEWDAQRQCYTFSDVIGPDEYHDHVNNNAYTNLLAQWNLQIALETLDWLKQHFPTQAQTLTERLRLTPESLGKMRDVAEKILILEDENGLIEQFEGYFKLKDVNLSDYEPRTRSMHEIFGIEEANHYQIIKQPDVLMLLYLLRERYDQKRIRINYDYYNPRTDHTYGSSLGPSIQAAIACVMGDVEDAYEHFLRAARADLRDVRGNAGDGIHAASAGGIWQAVVFGFAGLRVHGGEWAISPRLPKQWKRLSFRFWLHGKQHIVDIP
ncbi:MAG TPA: glycoside hydrolase family 65 protein [Anaerolineales bacterium]|nr:glycoside hydrolase family 65 protein [Anaerolineales bacterium]